MKNSKIIVVIGPTSVGKSDYAVKLAKKIGGEIVSADSRQVYKGLDIGTGKITKKEMLGIPHHLLDVTDPKKVFSVDQYQKLAISAMREILKKGKTPIICGGTGFYIDAVMNGTILPKVPPNKILRKKLSKLSTEKLLTMLKKIDPARAKSIDQKNPVRLIRAIEIAKALGKVPKIKKVNPIGNSYRVNIEWIGIDLPDEILKKKIHKRLLERFKKGMLNEIKKLHANGLSWKRMNELGLEYRYMAKYLNKKITKVEMLDQLEKAIWQYVKRQRTWWRRNTEINWIKK